MRKKLHLTIIFLFFSTITLLAQAPPTPPVDANNLGGPVGGTSGGSAPVGSGLVIMLVMGAAYAGIKGVKSLDNKATESEEVNDL